MIWLYTFSLLAQSKTSYRETALCLVSTFRPFVHGWLYLELCSRRLSSRGHGNTQASPPRQGDSLTGEVSKNSQKNRFYIFMSISPGNFLFLYGFMGGYLYISLSNGWFWIKCHLLIRMFLRLVTAGWNVVTKGRIFFRLSLFVEVPTSFRWIWLRTLIICTKLMG